MNWYKNNLDLMALGEHVVDTFELHTAAVSRNTGRQSAASMARLT